MYVNMYICICLYVYIYVLIRNQYVSTLNMILNICVNVRVRITMIGWPPIHKFLFYEVVFPVRHYEKCWCICFRYHKFNILDKGNRESRSVVSLLCTCDRQFPVGHENTTGVREKKNLPAVFAQEERGCETVCTKLEHAVTHKLLQHTTPCLSTCKLCSSISM